MDHSVREGYHKQDATLAQRERDRPQHTRGMLKCTGIGRHIERNEVLARDYF